jgi:hypothetical protein
MRKMKHPIVNLCECIGHDQIIYRPYGTIKFSVVNFFYRYIVPTGLTKFCVVNFCTDILLQRDYQIL